MNSDIKELVETHNKEVLVLTLNASKVILTELGRDNLDPQQRLTLAQALATLMSAAN